MRLETESILHPVAPVSEIPAELAGLRPGQTFSARIQEVLPENTYKALVAGRTVTLALPEGAEAGDTLELVVIDRTPRLVVAQLANRNGPGGTAPDSGYEFANLSRTAQLIGTLLARDGEAPQPAALTRGHALLAAAPANTTTLAAELAPQLAKAVSQSGLFYEAHQVQWVMGQRTQSTLLAEPQARHSSTEAGPGPGLDTSGPSTRNLSGGWPVEPAGSFGLLQTLFGGGESRPTTGAQSSATANPTLFVPEDLRPLVQQQLDAVATQRLAWHGEVWPGQLIDWQIEPDDQRASGARTDADQGWTTSLRLTTPRLGEINARLSLAPQGVGITLSAPDAASVADLRDAVPVLEKSMTAAGVPLLAMQVRRGGNE